jgi:hypothetical protein
VLDASATPSTDLAAGSGLASQISDQGAEDLDAPGWGTEGSPTEPRQLSADVAAMTTPTPSTARPDELGE